MIRKIVSIAGKPGLYKLVSQGRNMLIVEALATGRRTPAYAHDKVISLADVAIYTTEEDMPLGQVLDKVKAATNVQTVDIKAYNDADLRAYFGTILPNFDQDRVYTTDIRKLFSWYNLLISAGITDFLPEKEESAEADVPAEHGSFI